MASARIANAARSMRLSWLTTLTPTNTIFECLDRCAALKRNPQMGEIPLCQLLGLAHGGFDGEQVAADILARE